MKNVEELLKDYVENEYNDLMPEGLAKYSEKFKQTLKPFIQLTVKPEKTELWESKFGGNPYIPIGFDYPKNSTGNILCLLAQINFEEMPITDGFPEKGILQFFINFSEDSPDTIGMNFEDQVRQENFRVIYHEEVTKDSSKLLTDFSFISDEDLYESPVSGEYKVYPSISFEPVSATSYEFWELLGVNEDELEDDELDELYEAFEATGHKIGGYPYFTQSDPRDGLEDYSNFDTLLFQLDSDSEEDTGIEIMWGDSGVGNFFINSNDLKKLDFSKVLYNWDCC